MTSSKQRGNNGNLILNKIIFYLNFYLRFYSAKLGKNAFLKKLHFRHKNVHVVLNFRKGP